MDSIFDKIGKKDLLDLINIYKEYIDVDVDSVYTNTLSHIKNIGSCTEEIHSKVSELESYWYSTQAINPDYSVYDDPYYICDIWACWKLASRRYLQNINRPNSLSDMSIVEYMSDVKNILDIGCGTGYTTAGLKELFPDAIVTGTNIKDTVQYRLAEGIGKNRGFTVTDTYNGHIDLIFASEYFEHFKMPIDHLLEVIEKYSPKYMIIANSFSNTAIGHFDEYVHNDKIYIGKQMTKYFNETMRKLGYEKQKTKCWNDKPNFWQKIDVNDMFGDE